MPYCIVEKVIADPVADVEVGHRKSCLGQGRGEVAISRAAAGTDQYVMPAALLLERRRGR